MPLPTTPELIASLDEELIDLLSERMNLAATLKGVEGVSDGEGYVAKMRNLAAVHRLSPDLGEAIARAIVAEEAKAQTRSRK